MKLSILFFVYLVGWIGCLIVGMQIEAWRWRKRSVNDIRNAYARGFDSGREFSERVQTERDEFKSSVRILTGEEGYDDESFSGS